MSKLTAVRPGRRVYVEIDFSGPVAFGAYSYITDALRLLGAEGIFGGEPREWLTPNLDNVRDADPDVVVYEAKMFSRFSENDLHDLFSRRGWSNMRAYRKGHVFLAPGPLDFLAHHGPSFITVAMPWLRERLLMAG